MTISFSEGKAMLLEFVHGARSWKSLEKVGVYVEVRENYCQVDNPWLLVVTVTPGDVARGLLALRNSTDALQTWAEILLAGSSFIELGPAFETDPRGETLKAALWDLTFGEPLSEGAVETAKELSRLRGAGI